MNPANQLTTIADYERECRRITPPATFEFLFGTVGDPYWSTYSSNRAAFDSFKLRPRVLTGVDEPRLETELLGHHLSLPLVVGPTGVLPDPVGEITIANAVRKADTIQVVSSVPTASTEDIAAAAAGHWWQQTFIYTDRSVTEWQVKRAVDLGAGAIVLTVTTLGSGNYRHQNPPFTSPTPEPTRHFTALAEQAAFDLAGLGIDSSAGWWDVDWLRSLSDLPLVVKGIQTAEDAHIGVEHGIDGVVVSNHGGRFAQGVRGTMEVLPEIVDAIGNKIPISIDGGVRQGQDILKALATGASTVWIGRPVVWGQTIAGEDGVRAVLEILRDELRSLMGLCGVAGVSEVDRTLVTRRAIPTVEY